MGTALQTHNPLGEANRRGARMLRTALGPVIAAYLEDPDIVEVMLNPDGRLWVDRLSSGLSHANELILTSESERIIRLVAHHVGLEAHECSPRISAELPETGERFEGLLPPLLQRQPFLSVSLPSPFSRLMIMSPAALCRRKRREY